MMGRQNSGRWPARSAVEPVRYCFFLTRFLARPLLGDWLVGFRESPASWAMSRTEATVRPSFRPITRVGVFSLINCFNSRMSPAPQGLRVLRMYFGVLPAALALARLAATILRPFSRPFFWAAFKRTAFLAMGYLRSDPLNLLELRITPVGEQSFRNAKEGVPERGTNRRAIVG